ncbi:polyprenol monophosphomannose synthase [Endomicrobium proavitum]|uniref:Putative glycosyl transferase n=1 Tax=Endomicrobium proavitum TaxID=1408281 RepID=A0A0G3WJV2_9BACT|nr:polyprenol monophosphomannose synthase [Endomicrobium proavitum]AKL97779.1 putative glycosyl transferase [Endomicrobium proavitum]
MKIIAMIPTYNEASNIETMTASVINCGADVDVLIVDDMSPDGTYKIVEEIAKTNSKVHLLLRKENRGRGYAGIDGFKKALEMGADFIVEMDGDGSHDPKYIPAFLKTIKSCDVVIGSRFVSGGKDEARGFLRHAISNLSRVYLSFVLGVKIKDSTSGYRMFKREVLASFVNNLKANDPFIVTEVIYWLKKNKFIIKEYPIEFLSRFSGQSKLRPLTLIKYLFKVLKLKIAG